MTAEELIKTVNTLPVLYSLIPDLSNWKTTLKEFLMLVHPDKCSLPGASDATSKLNLFKDELENGVKYNTDIGEAIFFFDKCIIKGNLALLEESLRNYNIIKNGKNEVLKRYIPTKVEIINNELVSTFPERALPLTHIGSMPQAHAAWILGRMMDFSLMLSDLGYCHAGITPESIFVVPNTHGIICTSFFHMKRLGDPLVTMSGRFKNYYPTLVFDKKRATSWIDIELAKRVAVYITGDKSGSGMKLKINKDFNSEWVNFLLKFNTKSSSEVFKEYRELINKEFKKEFYKLDI